jgi:threonine dehydratase
MTGADLFLSAPKTPGAFKVRGASNAVFGPDDEQAKLGVQQLIHHNTSCLSYAASRRGIPCNVDTRTAPQQQHCRALWRVVTECDPSTTSREEMIKLQPRRVAISCTLQRSARDRAHLRA